MTIDPVPVTLFLESDGNIFTITLDGADKTYLTFDGNADGLNMLASWSSDGSKIVYTKLNSTDAPASGGGGVVLPIGHIWTMNADGSDQRELTFGPIYGSLPSFSPDGNSILFTGFATGNPELWLMSSDGTDPRPITHTAGSQLAIDGTTIKWSTHGAFSPDGTKIAYSRTESGHDEIWVMNTDGSDQIQLTFPNDPNAPDANNANWSPDGSKITFAGGFAHGDSYIFTINPDGSDRTQLTFVSSDDPAWSPDGQEIIYDVFGSDGQAQAWIMAADGTNQRLLSTVPVGPSRVVAIEKVRAETGDGVPAIGTASGDPHFTTYDGVHYDYQGVGDFLLTRSTLAGDQFEVQIRTRSVNDSAAVTIISEAAATLSNHHVTFDIDRASAGESFVWLDGHPSSLSVDNPALTLGGSGIFELSPEHYQVVWDTGEVLEVTNNGTYLDLSSRLSWIDGLGSMEGLLSSEVNPDGWRLTGATSLLDDVPEAGSLTLLG